MTEKDLARTTRICGGALILMIVMGIGNCTIESPACMKDPCWKLLVGCSWMTFNSPVVLGLAALVVSIIGLNTWRAQLRGTTRYKAALRVLRALRGFRSAVVDARLMFQATASFRYWNAQGGTAPAESHFDPDEAEHEASTRTYRGYDRLRIEADEATHLWGPTAGTVIDGVMNVAHEIRTALALARVAQQKTQDREPDKWTPTVLYAPDAEDTFTPRFDAAVDAAIKFFQDQL